MNVRCALAAWLREDVPEARIRLNGHRYAVNVAMPDDAYVIYVSDSRLTLVPAASCDFSFDRNYRLEEPASLPRLVRDLRRRWPPTRAAAQARLRRELAAALSAAADLKVVNHADTLLVLLGVRHKQRWASHSTIMNYVHFADGRNWLQDALRPARPLEDLGPSRALNVPALARRLMKRGRQALGPKARR